MFCHRCTESYRGCSGNLVKTSDNNVQRRLEFEIAKNLILSLSIVNKRKHFPSIDFYISRKFSPDDMIRFHFFYIFYQYLLSVIYYLLKQIAWNCPALQLYNVTYKAVFRFKKKDSFFFSDYFQKKKKTLSLSKRWNFAKKIN